MVILTTLSIVLLIQWPFGMNFRTCVLMLGVNSSFPLRFRNPYAMFKISCILSFSFSVPERLSWILLEMPYTLDNSQMVWSKLHYVIFLLTYLKCCSGSCFKHFPDAFFAFGRTFEVCKCIDFFGHCSSFFRFHWLLFSFT